MFTPLVLLSLLAPHSVVGAPFLATADPTTQFAQQLCLARVELVEMQTLYQAEHPLLEKQQRRVRAMEQSLAALGDQGYRVDEKRVDAMLDTLLQQTTAELDVARQELTSSHPRLALLELRCSQSPMWPLGEPWSVEYWSLVIDEYAVTDLSLESLWAVQSSQQ